MSLGFGVMLHRLTEDGGSASTFRKALGKTIDKISLEDDAAILRFQDGTAIRVADEGQSCCENRYMRTDDDLVSFAGGTLVGGEVRDAPNVSTEDDYGSHDVQFLVLQTSKGDITFSSHNEHNGYYGGFAIQVSDVAA